MLWDIEEGGDCTTAQFADSTPITLESYDMINIWYMNEILDTYVFKKPPNVINLSHLSNHWQWHISWESCMPLADHEYDLS